MDIAFGFLDGRKYLIADCTDRLCFTVCLRLVLHQKQRKNGTGSLKKGKPSSRILDILLQRPTKTE